MGKTISALFAFFQFLAFMPALAAPESIGYYSGGSIKEAAQLPLEGAGFVKIFRDRKVWYGSSEMISVLQDVSKQIKTKYMGKDRIQIADLSKKGGGFVSGHVSHQNGLDVDIAYIRFNQTEQDPRFDQNATSGFQEIFVRKGRVLPNFDVERNWELVRLLIASKKVQRVFVDAAVKSRFCQHLKAKGLLSSFRHTMSRVRIEEDHTEHIHVRFFCPTNNPSCKKQDDVSGDVGCD